jgi:hypothetical protein
VRPLIVFVEKLDPVLSKRPKDIVISPVVLFDKPESYEPQYTFVQCLAGSDTEIDDAATWVQAYANKFEGSVVTNFDEQRPILANAPLSYQKLVSKTYDRAIVNKYAPVLIEHIENLTYQEINRQTFLGETHVGHNVNVTGHAIIAIDSTLNNVTQAIGTAPGLNDKQKSELDELVKTLRTQLEPLKATHADEAKEIADAVEKAVANVSKPAPERKLSMLQLSAKGLTEAANLVKDIAPTVIATAGLIAKFVVGV